MRSRRSTRSGSSRRSSRIALAVVTAAALTGLVGCGALDKAMDCARTADAIATSVDKLSTAVSGAAEDPTKLNEALDDIDKELASLNDTTDNADLSKATDDLNKAVDNVRAAVKNGDETPDIGPVTDAAGEIGKVCTP